MRALILFSVSFLSALCAAAQCPDETASSSFKNACAEGRAAAHRAAGDFAKTTVASLEEDRYDVRHVKLDLQMTNADASITGLVTTTAVALDSAVPAYTFELIQDYTVDSVRLNGAPAAVTYDPAAALYTAAFPAGLPAAGALFTAEVWYRGAPTFTPGFFSGGIYNDVSPTWGSRVTWTLSQPYDARGWWPCKQSLQDKIDSVDVWITVPNSSLKAGSNGVLRVTTPLPGGAVRYEWAHRHPIDYYLVSAAVGPYVDYAFNVGLPGDGPADSMAVHNYVYDNPATLPFWKTQIDSTALMIQQFSALFGRYPFWGEKYGHSMAPMSGGMEHQTMTTQANFRTGLTAHELGHQWWGDAITCASWRDLWLNEGFASYCEYLFYEGFRGDAAALTHIRAVQKNVTEDGDGNLIVGGTVYVDDTTDEGRLFSGRLTYNKGAAVLHTLRYVVGDNSLFFAAMRAYRAQYEGSTATTEDFKHSIEATTGLPLDSFFAQWVYGHGFPMFSAGWNQVDSTVILQLGQTSVNPASVPIFSTPVDVRFSGPAGDTTVRIHSGALLTDAVFTWNKPVVTVEIDPQSWLLKRVGSVVQDGSLTGIGSLRPQGLAVWPNPTRTSWTFRALDSGAALLLTDMAGRPVWQGMVPYRVLYTEVPAQGLPAGIYFLRVVSPGGAVRVARVVKE